VIAMSKWLDAAMASPRIAAIQPRADSAVTANRSNDPPAVGAIDTKGANGTTEKKQIPAIDHPAVHHPAVQAVLARFPGAAVVAVRQSPEATERTFKSGPDIGADPPLSAASTAALGPPTLRTTWVAERQTARGFRIVSRHSDIQPATIWGIGKEDRRPALGPPGDSLDDLTW
jgi:hypothetical protein